MTAHSQEPQISVRNIPQSQYNNSVSSPGQDGGMDQPAAGEGGIKGHLKKNWPLYALGLGAATIVVMLYINNQNNSASDPGSTGIASDPTGGAGQANTLYGSQLEADNQQIMSLQNQILATLNSSTGNPGSALTGTVRNASAVGGQTYGFDTKYKGVPIRDSPGAGGKIIGWDSFGQMLNFSGPAIYGQNNFGLNNNAGNNLWEPLVGGGYVSSYDITHPNSVGA